MNTASKTSVATFVISFIFINVGQSLPIGGESLTRPIFPVVECPEDALFPHVIATPFLNGQLLEDYQYVVCIRGEPLIFNCSDGLLFNWELLSCGFPEGRPSITRSNNGTSADGDLDLIAVRPVIPISPQKPVPIWGKGNHIPQVPAPAFPITKPNPAEIRPIPVLPAQPPQLFSPPIPHTNYN